MPALTIRLANETDAVAVWRLISATDELDHNSFYCYHVLCTRFGATCAVAEIDGKLVGCVTGFTDPARPDTLFVWQMAVDPDCRGRSIVSQLLDRLVAEHRPRLIEATVSPGNTASRRSFEKLAVRHQAAFTETPYLDETDFPPEAGTHEPEQLVRVGPLPDAAG